MGEFALAIGAGTNGSNPQGYAAIVLAVGHEQFVELGEAGIKALGQPGAVLFDVKAMLPRGAADARL